MAKYLDLTGLTSYDTKIKTYIATAIANADEVGVVSISSTASSVTTGQLSELQKDFALIIESDTHKIYIKDGPASNGVINMVRVEVSTSSVVESEIEVTVSSRAVARSTATLSISDFYTKSETYTKNEVNTLIGNLQTIQIQVVASLPSTGQSNVIYLVSHSHGTGDSYDEYVWVTDASVQPAGGYFEKIGNTDVDLSNYYTKSETDTLLSAKQNTLTFDNSPTSGSNNPVKSGGVYTALGNKVDVVSGKGLSTNDFTTTLKDKLDGIASGAQVNVIETVKKNGTALTVTSKAVDIIVPTKVSDLTNDSGFITGVDTISSAEIDALFA